ncbi:MAG: CBS domain-containing protein [bacterium]|nr:CBS domain-containing protein [bacterium]MBU1918302.1 CBS domain-containing protein [bacterium]
MFEAKTIMTKVVVTVRPDTPAMEAVRLLVKNSISGLPVVDDDNKLVGIVSEKDLLKFIHDPEEKALTVSSLMTKKVICFDENTSGVEICNCLVKNNFRRVPVLKDGRLVGVVSRRDILRKILEMKNVNITNTRLEGEDA